MAVSTPCAHNNARVYCSPVTFHHVLQREIGGVSKIASLLPGTSLPLMPPSYSICCLCPLLSLLYVVSVFTSCLWLLQPGHLFTMYFKEKLEEVLVKVRQQVMKDARTDAAKTVANAQSARHIASLIDRWALQLVKLCTSTCVVKVTVLICTTGNTLHFCTESTP